MGPRRPSLRVDVNRWRTPGCAQSLSIKKLLRWVLRPSLEDTGLFPVELLRPVLVKQFLMHPRMHTYIYTRYAHADIQMEEHRQTDKQADRQTDWQTARQANRQTPRPYTVEQSSRGKGFGEFGVATVSAGSTVW